MPGAAPHVDGVIRVETPEGIELALVPAGPVPRGLALSIDLLIRWGLLLAAAIPLGYMGELGFGGILLLMFGLEWLFPVAFEVLVAGQTPGKRALGLRVVNGDATPVGWTASLLRNLLRVADLAPLFYVAGVVSMCCNDRFQRLGDLAAGTLVVHTHVEPTEGGVDPDWSGSRPAPVPLRPDEQRALIAFAERAGSLSPERRIEIADVLSDLSGSTGEAGVGELMRIARGVASGA